MLFKDVVTFFLSHLNRRLFSSVNLRTMKLDTPEFRELFTPEMQMLSDMFNKYGHELRIAGGAVRDLLMSNLPKDVDFATTATPEQMKNMFTKEEVRMLNKKGESHGTITARINDNVNFEVTTLRIDVLTDGRHAEVRFTTDWHLDAHRRDLTINSMFLGLDGTVFDYFDGINDLAKRRIAFVGDPVKRIQEDYLRILRYFRFYGRIAEHPDKHEAETIEAIRQNASGLAKVSGERIWGELKKILAGNHVGHLIPIMMDAGLATYIGLPENPSVDIFRTVHERSKHLNPLPMTLLAPLLRSDEEMVNLHLRLKLSADERDLGLFLTEHRDDKPHEDSLKPYQSLVLRGNKRVVERVCELFKYRGEQEQLAKFREWQPPKFPVNGHMLIQRGIKGKKVGIIMSKLTNQWIESNFTLTENELLAKLNPRFAGNGSK